jgi:haloalkane dehalogenase
LCKAPGIGPALVRGANGFALPATWMAMHRRQLGRDERRAYLFPYDSWAHRVAVSAFVRDIPMRPTHPSWPVLETVEKGLARFRENPVRLVWGGSDFCFDESFLDRWREIFPAAGVRRIADAGHYVLEDAPEEAVPDIAGFLAAPSRP